MMKKMTLTLLGGMLLLFAGCATAGHGGGMACAKCDCKMMRAEAADSSKCAMCKHGASDHNRNAGQKAEPSEHKH